MSGGDKWAVQDVGAVSQRLGQCQAVDQNAHRELTNADAAGQGGTGFLRRLNQDLQAIKDADVAEVGQSSPTTGGLK